MTLQELVEIQPQPLDPAAIIRELDESLDRLPEAALRTCQQHRELMIPRLIETVEEAVRLGREGKVREGNAHFFALYLLTEFKAQQAWPAIMELLTLRDPVLEGLIGDAVTDFPRRVFAVFLGDQPELIEALIGNQSIDDFIRWEAASALCCLVRDGRLSRADVLSRLHKHLQAAVEAGDVWGATILVSQLGDLNPLELQDEIRSVFERDLIDESMIDWTCFEEYLLLPDQPGACPELEREKPSRIADTVEEMRGWHCFSEEAQRARDSCSRKTSLLDALPQHFLAGELLPERPAPIGTIRQDERRVGRNDPCPCGSGKKYKKCCLKAEQEE